MDTSCDPNETREEAQERLSHNNCIREKMYAADVAGDHDEARRLWATQVFSARILMAAKMSMGGDWIRERNRDTRLADIKFGPGWLDND